MNFVLLLIIFVICIGVYFFYRLVIKPGAWWDFFVFVFIGGLAFLMYRSIIYVRNE